MARYSYTYQREGRGEPQEKRCYRKSELELMTTYQLRDICYRERIINGMHAPLDRDVLMREILRFRGRAEQLFITEHSEEGIGRLEQLLGTAKLNPVRSGAQGCAKLIVYEGISVEVFDGYSIGYMQELEDTNALLVSRGSICAVFNLRSCRSAPDQLFVTKSAAMACRESAVRSYELYCMERRQSEQLYRIYQSSQAVLPEHLTFYVLPVLNFEVRSLLQSNMPLAIDFGSSNTTAGVYLDHSYFEKRGADPAAERLKRDAANYVTYHNTQSNDEETPVLPSVAAVVSVSAEHVEYRFGYEARRLLDEASLDEGLCIFYDLKRWVADAQREEEVIDRRGNRSFVPRREIIRAYLLYVIGCAQQRFKCRFSSIHLSAPVKQKPLFLKLFGELLADYRLEAEPMLDEGVAVLYHTISSLIRERSYTEGQTYRALMIDCGGGTTDLSSCRFQIVDRRVAYQIEIATSYENGSTDFGGNNLTYRVMQLLKLALAGALTGSEAFDTARLLSCFEVDLFRSVDEQGAGAVYEPLDKAYAQAEAVLPTRFQEYEQLSRADYYAVKNNFYTLFDAAERVKTCFYSRSGLLRVVVCDAPVQEEATGCVQVQRWKLSVRRRQEGGMELLKEIPQVSLSIYALNLLLRADIYGIVRQFLHGPYERGELSEYSILRLTGQSCRIEMFREALKEFIPGRMIQSARTQGQAGNELKMVCLNGAIEYLKDKLFGYADVRMIQEQGAFPYVVTAFTHTGEEITLIHSLNRERIRGVISRNMTDLTLRLHLKDLEGRQRYVYSFSCQAQEFAQQQAQEISAQYAGQIRQAELDNIVDQELKFFVLAEEERWGFTVVPVLRREGQLCLGRDVFFRFETEGWLTNFFDGTK